MVDVLAKKLCHLGDGILFAILHKDCDKWYLSPYKYPLFVTEIIEILVMLIVCKSDGVGTFFQDYLHIFHHVTFIYRIALAFSILMPTDTSQRIASAVKIETLVWEYLNCPEAYFQ